MRALRRRLTVLAGVLVGGLTLLPADPLPGQPRASPGGLTGQLLIATPALRDPNFEQTVVYLVHHDGDGAMGIVVNRPVGEIPLATLLTQSGLDARGVTGTLMLHRGGPVAPTRIVVLHSDDDRAPGTERLSGGLALTWQADILRALAAGGGPRRALFAVGHAGWAAGQLEDEIRAGAWVVAPSDPGLLFDDRSDTKWERAFKRQRIEL
jgi:putative transcriptional regulator